MTGPNAQMDVMKCSTSPSCGPFNHATILKELWGRIKPHFGITRVATIDHFTVMWLVAWPLNENEAGGDLVLIETSLLFFDKLLLISIRTASLTEEKQGSFYQNKVTSSLTFIQRTGR